MCYRFHAPDAADTDGYDFSLDDFFTESIPPTFEQGPFVEVMAWFAHQITYSSTFTPWTAPTLVNSTVSPQPWDAGYWCHGVDNGTNPNVSFDYSHAGQDSSGLAAGTIGVNLSLILSDVKHRMLGLTCWTGPTKEFSQFHLDDTNLGSEDEALGGTSFNYYWTVNAYCFHVERANQSTADLGCRSSLLRSCNDLSPRVERLPRLPLVLRGEHHRREGALRGSSASHLGLYSSAADVWAVLRRPCPPCLGPEDATELPLYSFPPPTAGEGSAV
ncbi:MAG: hypothetical protein ABSB97_05075 [Thermoplasmata archaeon]